MLTTLVPVVIFALAVVAAAASAVFFLRARARETSFDETDAVAADGLVEMRALGQRIETLVGQQQLQGATDRQHLAQKIDAVGEHLEQQRNGLSGLQNELRYEVNRRDAEMDEIRTQLASIQHATALGASTSEPGHAPLALAPAADAPFADASFADDPAEEPFAPFAFERPDVEAPAFEMPSFETLPSTEVPAPFPGESLPTEPFPAEPMGDGLAADFGAEVGEAPSALTNGWDTGDSPLSPAPDAIARPVFSDPFAFVDPFAASEETAPEPAGSVEPAAVPDSEFEPFDFAPLADLHSADLPTSSAEDDRQPLAPPAGPPSLFENVSFGSLDGTAFRGVTTPAAPAVSPAEAPTHAPPTLPSDSAWVARADRPAAGAPPFATGTGEAASAPEPAEAFPQETAASDAPAFHVPAFEAPAFVAPVFEAPAFEAPAFEAPAFEAPAFEAPAFQTPAFEAPTSETPANEGIPPPSLLPPAAAPVGADDLTAISTVTDDIQRLLYSAGVTSLDEIARWSRADARRISTVVSVSEETILNQWVFEAQAALFQSFRA